VYTPVAGLNNTDVTLLPTFDSSLSMVDHLSSNRTLAVPRSRTSFGDGRFAVAGPPLWNSLPTNLRQMISQ